MNWISVIYHKKYARFNSDLEQNIHIWLIFENSALPQHTQYYPLLILETTRPSPYNDDAAQVPLDYKQQGLWPPAPVDHPQRWPQDERSNQTSSNSSCWDWRACKIGACIILIFLVAVGAFIAYVMYQKYCC